MPIEAAASERVSASLRPFSEAILAHRKCLLPSKGWHLGQKHKGVASLAPTLLVDRPVFVQPADVAPDRRPGEHDFDEPRFAPGRVYFLNTQNIGKEKKLITPGDRTSTLWETIARTIDESPGSFWVCIDEAHRGMNPDIDPTIAASVVQKFIVGSPEEIPAAPPCPRHQRWQH